ncbi:hypothetical protein PISMIDRAFT_353015 [Pisolithus microcarpus 441]|uniref:DUF8212 domain-containing protein n=1 Tax=Pisolithus microcarpus 441 TaxID=765257 RepID=A0A0C9YJJ8_9AGAM|nr:hypothetical protein BKA83DRAFT_353015 [Pisolithus microcarpus]KIK25110.1 hypothetical protein PISMIDRAFT_353015 [Pisolithus microcarpus 441]
MSWAADRKTTRVEDRAYSLLGLFGVNMPMLYGEGLKAFQRLQLEITRVSSDHSIFAWNPKGQLGKYGSVLADDPSCFRGCHNVKNMDPDGFAEEVEELCEGELAVAADQGKLLSFRSSVDPSQLLRWDVTNLGIHLSLPVLPSRHGGSFYRAILPCRDRHGNLVTIDLQSRGRRSYRAYPAKFGHSPVYACPEFRPLYLDCSQEPEEGGYELQLWNGSTSSYGFTLCGTFPREVAGDTVTFSSQGNTLIVLVYANDDAGSRFAVGLGYYLGQVWGCVVREEYFV